MVQPYRDQHDIYEDRGDPVNPDFDLGDLTTNGDWHDLDLSGIVPENAKAVFLRLNVKDDAAGNYIQFREKGNSNERNSGMVYTQVASIPINADLGPIRMDRNRTIEYRTSNVVFTTIYLVIKGWLY